jgi:outer membrane protein OmpA-like peptidoglycan-associated protein
MRELTKVAVLLTAIVCLASACATRGWVRQALSKQETEVGQRINLVEGRVTGESQKVGQRLEGVDSRVNTVEGRVTDESQKVGQRFEGMDSRVKNVEGSVGAAGDLAQGAQAKADNVDSRLTRLWAGRYNQKVTDTFDVTFGFDRADLGDSAQTVLASVLKELQANPNLTVELTGYTDPKGPRDYNYQLSQRRAEAVQRFLVDKGVQLSRVRLVGLGPIVDPLAPAEKKRRVTVKLMVDQD